MAAASVSSAPAATAQPAAVKPPRLQQRQRRAQRIPSPAQRLARRGSHEVPQGVRPVALVQGEERGRKNIGNTIVNSLIFGVLFASCGAAAFGACRNACC